MARLSWVFAVLLLDELFDLEPSEDVVEEVSVLASQHEIWSSQFPRVEHFDIRKCVSDRIRNPAVKWIVLDCADQGRCPKRNWDFALSDLRRECVVNLLDNLDVVHLSLSLPMDAKGL